ncbi:uncharacterized protein F5891DRAFT_1243630 [Suillus fuscotomentosus]|uniref:F-box domain-containing protein n=1 Tax=Suillus fuscotomentosus TaxID=1912939 RepID=A0AAD4E031_9AGAM|nr:uncharacterized protein F5891DRAFT_1243630 [Suillus fuscotomentosus]KAG1897080.1 hypothetical protein F5891DRAFT_1243630 [Suillus fuscotomentosus]
MQTVDNSEVNVSSLPADINDELRNIIHDIRRILTTDRSQVIIPDLETEYSGSTDNQWAFEFGAHQSIRAIIAEREQQLHAVSQEISGLKTMVDIFNNLHEQLVEKKDKIKQSMELHKGFVSPLWSLPNEILSKIFVHCLPEDEHLSLAQNEAPMLLTRVCKKWRGVAVATSDLWYKLHLNLKNKTDLQQQDNLYHSCLERSKGRPLSLVIDCYAHQMLKLRKFLRPYYSHHIASISTPCFRGTRKVLGEFQALQELTLNNTTSRTSSTVATCLLIVPLTVLSLKVKGSFSLDRNLPPIPALTHLTHIEVSLCSLSVVLRLIRPSSNLSSLVIRQYTSERIPPVDSAQVLTHTALQSLRILETNMSAASLLPGLFNILSLPNLRALEVSGSQPWPHEEAKAFLTRSNCPLESLTFGAKIVTTDEQRAEYAALIPSLVVSHFVL